MLRSYTIESLLVVSSPPNRLDQKPLPSVDPVVVPVMPVVVPAIPPPAEPLWRLMALSGTLAARRSATAASAADGVS